MAKFAMFDDWPEFLALVILLIGFVVSLAASSKVVSFIIIFFCGAAFGRLWFKLRGKLHVPSFLVILGFLIGFLLGTRYGSRGILIVLFVAGMVLSFYLHDRKIIKSSEY